VFFSGKQLTVIMVDYKLNKRLQQLFVYPEKTNVFMNA